MFAARVFGPQRDELQGRPGVPPGSRTPAPPPPPAVPNFPFRPVSLCLPALHPSQQTSKGPLEAAEEPEMHIDMHH